MRSRTVVAAAVLALLSSCAPEARKPQTPQRPVDPIETKIDDLVGKMSLDEKLEMLGGTGFETKSLPRLGIPSLAMTDGPIGVRWAGHATAYPAPIAISSSFDPDLVRRIGVALGQETKAKGRRLLLGPCINIVRTPQGGRNFETYGEDPYLNGRMAVAWVQGVQAEHVIATPKHFAVNNQEWERDRIDVRVSERALYEIYFPAFKAAVQEGGALSVMASYNKVNGHHAAENEWLLDRVLKREWGFRGFVVSDWGAVHSSVATANSGLDLEMPTGRHLNPRTLTMPVRSGEIDPRTIDDKVKRMLRAMVAIGLFDPRTAEGGSANTPEHRALAREAAAKSIVLLKNDGGVLPLDRSKVHTIAVIGPNAATTPTGGGGSSFVEPHERVSALDGIRAKAGLEVTYALGAHPVGGPGPIEARYLSHLEDGRRVPGLRGEYFKNRSLSGSPDLVRTDPTIDFEWGGGPPATGFPDDLFSVRWTGTITPDATGTYEIATSADDGARVYVAGEALIDDWSVHALEHRSKTIDLIAGKSYDIRVEYFEQWGEATIKLGWVRPGDDLLATATRAAASADAAVVVVGTSPRIETEGVDRTELTLPEPQEALVQAVAAANPRTVVVLVHGQPLVVDRWIRTVPAVVEAWFPGQQGGHAIADVLFGDVNPSGRLPVTFPRRWEDAPSYGTYPGAGGTTEYKEGIYVGYRYYDTKKIAPQFPFGFGLSYSTFSHDQPVATWVSDGRLRVAVGIANTGARAGAEVVELYVHPLASAVDRPDKELKGFAKVSLAPGEKGVATFELERSAFARYDEIRHAFVVDPGGYDLLIGGSSVDIRGKATVELAAAQSVRSR